MFGRTNNDTRADLELFPTDKPGQMTIQFADIAAIIFSGKDTAFGQSWESWVQKKKEEGKKYRVRTLVCPLGFFRVVLFNLETVVGRKKAV